MGFLNFLKKKEGKKEGLDIPPPPPPSLQKAFSKEPTPKIDIPKFEQPKPKMQLIPKLDKPEIPFKPEKPKINIPKKIMEPIRFKPSFPKPEFKFPKPEFKPHIEQPKSHLEMHEEHEDIKPNIIPEKHVTNKEIFVRTENFKFVVDNLNSIKKKIKESEKALARLNDIKNSEDKEYEKWHSQLEDVQRKLMYADKTLFEVSKNG